MAERCEVIPVRSMCHSERRLLWRSSCRPGPGCQSRRARSRSTTPGTQAGTRKPHSCIHPAHQAALKAKISLQVETVRSSKANSLQLVGALQKQSTSVYAHRRFLEYTPGKAYEWFS